uniref:Uncharacterized protein n=1 Tax=Lepeophtheirus salmonis TaxID=72036 RepID=A0A0K2V327_LEPSM
MFAQKVLIPLFWFHYVFFKMSGVVTLFFLQMTPRIARYRPCVETTTSQMT